MPNVATTRILHAPEGASAPSPHQPWLWPLPRLDGIAPCILASATEAPPDSVEVGYPGRSDSVEVGYPGRSSSPSFVPVLAAQDGIIAYAGTTHGSPTICLDHAGGWSTQYADLAHVLVIPTDRFRRRRKVRVRAGEVLGHARRSPLRLRFALQRLTEGEWVGGDPSGPMPTWSVLPWSTEPTPTRDRAARRLRRAS